MRRPHGGPRAWLLPASSAFAGLSVALLAGVSAGPGCQTACEGDFDCLGSGFCDQVTGRCERDCFTDEDCQNPPECRDNPTACRPLGLFCSGSGRCRGQAVLDAEGVVREAPRGGGPTSIAGWSLSPGSGYAFIVDEIALAEEGVGFDLDGECTTSGCIDNAVAPLARFANDQVRQGLSGGESLLLFELAGIQDSPYTGYSETFTVKVYSAEDADEPFFPANNFVVPPGHDTCCEFKINAQSLVSPPPQARARAPATLDRGRFRSIAPVTIEFTLTVGSPPHDVVILERALLSGRLDRNLATVKDGLIGAALPVSVLHKIDNPYCRSRSTDCPASLRDRTSTLLDLIVALLGPEPDIDIDFDGRECLLDDNGDGTIEFCCDGRGANSRCPTARNECEERFVVGPLADPSSCPLSSRMNDGYSLAIAFGARRARIVGTGN